MHETADGKYTHNRKGKMVCAGFNNGTCNKFAASGVVFVRITCTSATAVWDST